MKIVEIADSVTLASLVKEDPSRSPGLHQSTIVGDIMRRLDPKRFGGEIRPEFIGLGLAIESIIAERVRRVILGWIKPGEFKKDGIIVSPDGIDPAFGPEELKATWTKGLPGPAALQNPKLLRYHMQGKNTCEVLGTDRIKFRVCFMNGNYAPPFPTLRTFVVRYGRQEIKDGWEQMLQHADDVGLRKR